MTYSDSEVFKRAGTLLCPIYGKKYACFVASGMAAIELALEYLGVAIGKEVIVADNICHTVAAAIVRVGAVPRFVSTGSSLLPTINSILELLNPNTVAVIAVHQYGLPFPIRRLREVMPLSCKLIEDASQGFGVISEGDQIGEHSDLVVTSFGSSKPLSLGGGGALFGDDAVITQLMDRPRGAGQRDRIYSARPYLLPTIILQNLLSQVNLAYEALSARRLLIESMSKLMFELPLSIWLPESADLPNWHKVPVLPASAKMENFLSGLCSDTKLVQMPHEIKTAMLRTFSFELDSAIKPSPSRYYLVHSHTLVPFFDLLKREFYD